MFDIFPGNTIYYLFGFALFGMAAAGVGVLAFLWWAFHHIAFI